MHKIASEMRTVELLHGMKTTYSAFAAVMAKNGDRIYEKTMFDALRTLE